ncbi:MAG: thioesterase family protein [Pseudomonadota bacterium]
MTKTREHFEPQPIRTSTRTVPPEWIDYNGHMNVAYYTMAIDHSLDEVFDMLGLGIELVQAHNMGPMAIQAQIHYLDELLEGEAFACDFQLLDADHKRMHLFVTMQHLAKGTAAATWEAMSMNVDLSARRSAPYPADCLARVESLKTAHSALPRPPLAGAAMGIRKAR